MHRPSTGLLAGPRDSEVSGGKFRVDQDGGGLRWRRYWSRDRTQAWGYFVVGASNLPRIVRRNLDWAGGSAWGGPRVDQAGAARAVLLAKRPAATERAGYNRRPITSGVTQCMSRSAPSRKSCTFYISLLLLRGSRHSTLSSGRDASPQRFEAAAWFLMRPTPGELVPACP
jgi:hypothetical protein